MPHVLRGIIGNRHVANIMNVYARGIQIVTSNNDFVWTNHCATHLLADDCVIGCNFLQRPHAHATRVMHALLSDDFLTTLLCLTLVFSVLILLVGLIFKKTTGTQRLGHIQIRRRVNFG